MSDPHAEADRKIGQRCIRIATHWGGRYFAARASNGKTESRYYYFWVHLFQDSRSNSGTRHEDADWNEGNTWVFKRWVHRPAVQWRSSFE